LDPDEGLAFDLVVDAAQRVREKLEEAGLVAFVMTTGGKGLHVVVPLRRTAGWEPLRAVSRAIAEELESEDPSRFVAQASKAARQGRIYVDYLRNGFGSTSINAYSTRARPGAPVATPLSWEELGAGARPADFTVETVPERLRRLKRDPWADYGASPRSLSRVVQARFAR